MSGERRYTRIPPESTGDRVYMIHTAEIEYNNKSAINPAYQWKVGDRYSIAGFTGGVVHVHGVYDTGDTGILSVHYNQTAKLENADPTVGSKISIGGVDVADVAAFYDVYIPANNIMGYDNPEYGLDVDITGSANIRFAEGLPQLDAWGKLRVAGATHIGDYVFGQEEVLTDNFSPAQLQGASVSYNDNRNSVTIKVPSSSDPDYVAGQGFASCSSNLYHHYVAGSSHLYMGTARLNNPTATGSSRNWGLFDANNGFIFNVDNNGNFNVIVRSSVTGSKVDNVIARADWNGDTVDGTGDSQSTLDLANDNIYWIDIQWHGAGRVRFGTYIDGARVTMHSYYHGNNYDVAMSQTTSLPVCWSIKRTSGAEELFLETWSASVWTETTLDLNEKGNSKSFASTHTTITANATDPWQYLFSLSPRVLLSNGETNHTLYMPTSISAYAYDETATNGLDAIVDLKMEVNSVHEGHSFVDHVGTSVQVSTTGTNYENGGKFLNEMFRGRYQTQVTDTFNNWQYGAVKNFSDDGGTVFNNIKTITTGSAITPPVVTIADGEVLKLRETGVNGQGGVEFPPNANEYNGRYEFYDIPSVPELEGQYVYIKPVAANQFEVYSDEALTTGFVVTSTHSANQGYAKGFRGSRITWSVFAKTRTAVHPTGPVKMMVSINWKEIVQ